MTNQEVPARHVSIAVEAEDSGTMTAEHDIESASLGATTVCTDPEIQGPSVQTEFVSETASLRAQIQSQIEQIKQLEDEIRNLKEQLKNQSINKEVKELLPILKRIDVNTRCSTSTSGTLRARFIDISTLSDEEIHSNSINVAGMDWAIAVQKQDGEGGTQSYLMAFLEIISPIPETWSGSVSYTIKLIRYTEKQPYTTHGNGLIFDAYNASWGRDCFIDFEDLLNPSNDYVKDDSINMEIDFIVYPSA